MRDSKWPPPGFEKELAQSEQRSERLEQVGFQLELPDDLALANSDIFYLLEDTWDFTEYIENTETPSRRHSRYPKLEHFCGERILSATVVVDAVKLELDATSDSVVNVSGVYASNALEAVIRIAERLAHTIYSISSSHRLRAMDVMSVGLLGPYLIGDGFSKEKMDENWAEIRAAVAALPTVDLQEVISLVERNIAQAWRWRKEQGVNSPATLSSARSPAEWEKVFDCSWDTLKRRLKSGELHFVRIHSKSYKLPLDEVPNE